MADTAPGMHLDKVRIESEPSNGVKDMANNDFIQATIEIFGAIITMLVAMIFAIVTKNRKKSQKMLLAILLASGFALIMDAGWYMSDGTLTQVGAVMNRICNFAIFLCNPIALIFVNRYVCNLIRENGEKPNPVLPVISLVASLLGILFPISNIFYQFMYYFDEKNIYHRLNGWYIYTVINLVAILSCFILIHVYRRVISAKHRISLYVFFMAPFVGTALQALVLGISFIQLGTALGSLVIVFMYTMDWYRAEKKDSEISEERKKIWIFECVFAIMILFISASIITCVVSVNTVSKENSEQNSTSLAYMVSETVESALAEPLNVSRTMAQSTDLIKVLENGEVQESTIEKSMLDFMKQIKETYDYQMVFAASDNTKAYYTYNGFSRIMEIEPDSVDSWFLDFRSSGQQHELNIDADKDNDMRLAVFVNMAVCSENGTFQGACGVAMSMESLMEILTEYEKEYHLNIYLVNPDGLIQVNTDRNKIENSYYDLSILGDGLQNGFMYQRDATKAIMVKSMDELGWYLIIEDTEPDKLDVFRIILPSMIIYVLGVAFMLVVSLVFGAHERRRSKELIVTKQQKQTAQEESNAKGRFLANMSHEIRTPINAVLGMDTMILRESTEPQIREYAMMIQNSGNILLSLINDILDISKIESGKMEIIPEAYDFAQLVLDVINMISLKAEKKGLDIKLELDPALPTELYGDAVRIRQIIVNLMNNAVKYTEEGCVTLSLSGEVDENLVRLRVCVRDTGIGIRKEDQDKLFEDFVRIEESRNKNIEGTGLGMSITVQLLELMNSRLEVASVYGEGSEFSFVLEQKILDARPIGKLSPHLNQRAESFTYESSFTAPEAVALVVDDNAINRTVFVNLLKETLIQIEEAGCGKDALESIFAKRYDIIFLDHMMPDMDGIEVLQHIRENQGNPNHETPVIVLTANAISGAKEEYLAAGFQDYLSKPIIPDQLEKMIVRFLPSQKLQEGKAKTAVQKAPEPELPMIEGVDWSYARLHLKDTNALISTAESFVIALQPEAEKLKTVYERLLADETDEEALELYRIRVHSMKSTANLLGFVPIAGMAATLEMAARGGEIDVLRDMTVHFLDLWNSYKEKLSFLSDSNPKSEESKKKIEDASLICDYYVQLKEAAAVFDVDGADSVLRKLKEYQYTKELSELMAQLEVAVNDLNADEIGLLCDKALSMMQR